MDLKFMQELYNKEFATRESLAQRATTIIAALTTLGGLLVFVSVNFKSTGSFLDVAFWSLTALSTCCLLTAAFYLIWSYRAGPLQALDKPAAWLAYWNDLKSQVAAGKLTSAENEFTNYLMQQYAVLGDQNIDANFKRGTRLVRSNNFLLASFALIVATSLTFYYQTYIRQNTQGVAKMVAKDFLFCLPATQALSKIPQEDGRGLNAFRDRDILVCLQPAQLENLANGPKPRPEPIPADTPPAPAQPPAKRTAPGE